MIAVIYVTFVVAKREPEKNSSLYGIQTLDLCDNSAALYQLLTSSTFTVLKLRYSVKF